MLPDLFTVKAKFKILFLQAITLVLRDILDALNSLHLKNICHGSVYLQSVFVEKRSGEYRGVLDFFPFTNSVSFILLINCCIVTTFQ